MSAIAEQDVCLDKSVWTTACADSAKWARKYGCDRYGVGFR